MAHGFSRLSRIQLDVCRPPARALSEPLVRGLGPRDPRGAGGDRSRSQPTPPARMKRARVKPAKAAKGRRTLGSLIYLVRQQNGWTLRQMSDKLGIPLSTLAKVEADRLSLTYDKLQQFTARRSLTRDGNSIPIATPNYDYEYLCADLREKRMVPILTRIRAHDIAEFG